MSSRKSNLGTSIAVYAASNILVLAAGLISFPITTRLLSSAEFGVLSFWEAGLLVLVAILKLGASDGAMRFYPHTSDPLSHSRYATNIVLTPALLGLVGWVGVVLLVLIAGQCKWLEHPEVALVASLQVLPLAWAALAFRVIQAREQAASNALLSVTWRWLTVGATLTALLWISPTAQSVLVAKLIVHVLIVGLLLWWLLPTLQFSRQSVDRAQITEGLHYGFPLALMELSNIGLWYVDRFMMKWLVNDYAVIGIYSIGFALASYIDQLLSTALSQALTPVTTRVYATEGADAVRVVKRRVLKPVIYICAAIGTGVILVGHDFLTLLASSSKAAATPVFIVMGLFFLIKTVVWTCADGLLLQKKSRIVFGLTVGAAIFNAVANIILIPLFGMMGAVYATGISLVLLQLLFFYHCPSELRVTPDRALVLKAVGAGLLCWVIGDATALFGMNHPLSRLATGSAWVLACFLLVALTDPDLRKAAQGIRERLTARFIC